MQRASVRLQLTQRFGRSSLLARCYSSASGSASEQLVRLEADHLPDGSPSGAPPSS